MSTISPATAASASSSTDPLALIDVDHVRFYVGNAKQAAFFYASAFGFEVAQISDLTTGSRESASYLLTQGNIRILLETPLNKSHPAADEVRRYGDGVKDIALTVFDAEKAWWGTEADGFAARVENERAWKVSIDTLRAANWNLDQKNPHAAEVVSHDPAVLLADYTQLQAQAQALRDELKDILAKSLASA